MEARMEAARMEVARMKAARIEAQLTILSNQVSFYELWTQKHQSIYVCIAQMAHRQTLERGFKGRLHPLTGDSGEGVRLGRVRNRVPKNSPTSEETHL